MLLNIVFFMVYLFGLDRVSMNKHPKEGTMKKKRLTGFTLMELMVISAIVGILLMLIVPGLHATRRKAHEAECINNIRQIAQAAIIYADEHKGVVPDVAPDPGGTDISLASSNYINADKVFLCPSDIRSQDEYGSFPTSYTAFKSTPTTMLPSGLKGMNCEAILYIESPLAGLASRSTISSGDIGIWHRDRTIVAFADGHAESIRYGQVEITAYFGHGVGPTDPADDGSPSPTGGDPSTPASDPAPAWPETDPRTPTTDPGIPPIADDPDTGDPIIDDPVVAPEPPTEPSIALDPVPETPPPGEPDIAPIVAETTVTPEPDAEDGDETELYIGLDQDGNEIIIDSESIVILTPDSENPRIQQEKDMIYLAPRGGIGAVVPATSLIDPEEEDSDR